MTELPFDIKSFFTEIDIQMKFTGTTYHPYTAKLFILHIKRWQQHGKRNYWRNIKLGITGDNDKKFYKFLSID